MNYLLEKIEGGMYIIRVPESVVAPFLAAGTKRALCSIDGAAPFHCAFQVSKAMGYYVYIGPELRRRFGLRAGSSFAAAFAPDPSPHGAAMPEELAEVLATDPEAGEGFNALTDGARRTLIHFVCGVKSSDKRIERALKIAERLRQGLRSARAIVAS